jgi:hypothetical protein
MAYFRAINCLRWRTMDNGPSELWWMVKANKRLERSISSPSLRWDARRWKCGWGRTLLCRCRCSTSKGNGEIDLIPDSSGCSAPPTWSMWWGTSLGPLHGLWGAPNRRRHEILRRGPSVYWGSQREIEREWRGVEVLGFPRVACAVFIELRMCYNVAPPVTVAGMRWRRRARFMHESWRWRDEDGCVEDRDES